jgi:hypothetical protein
MFRRIAALFTAPRDLAAARREIADHRDRAQVQADRRRADAISDARRAATARKSLIEALVTDYHHAEALYSLGRTNEFQMGMAAGLAQAIAHEVGLSVITVQFRLERGLPVTGSDWWTHRTDDGQVLVHHHGIAEDLDDHLTNLRADALARRGHPLARVYRDLISPTATRQEARP